MIVHYQMKRQVILFHEIPRLIFFLLVDCLPPPLMKWFLVCGACPWGGAVLGLGKSGPSWNCPLMEQD